MGQWAMSPGPHSDGFQLPMWAAAPWTFGSHGLFPGAKVGFTFWIAGIASWAWATLRGMPVWAAAPEAFNCLGSLGFFFQEWAEI